MTWMMTNRERRRRGLSQAQLAALLGAIVLAFGLGSGYIGGVAACSVEPLPPSLLGKGTL